MRWWQADLPSKTPAMQDTGCRIIALPPSPHGYGTAGGLLSCILHPASCILHPASGRPRIGLLNATIARAVDNLTTSEQITPLNAV
jgi:hypothetical protein